MGAKPMVEKRINEERRASIRYQTQMFIKDAALPILERQSELGIAGCGFEPHCELSLGEELEVCFWLDGEELG